MAIDTPAWVRDAVFYQIFPDRFARSERVRSPGPLEAWDTPPTVHGFKGGDLLGVAEHLDHIERLGANAIYFNPVFASASNHRYHTYDYLAVDPLLGGDAALRELLDAAHARGMRVLLDGVFNHASRGFWAFHHVMETGRHSPYRDWFYFNTEHLDAGRQIRAYPGQALSEALDVANVSDEQRLGVQSLEALGYRAWWDLPALPKLNVDNPHVRDYLLGVAEHWLRFGIDGWRLDVAEEIGDEFWREFRQRVKGVDPDAYIVAEIWREKPQYLQGDMYDAFMNYPLGEAILSFAGGDRLDLRVVGQHYELGANVRPEDGPTFARRVEHVLSVYDPAVTAVQLNLLGSHDTPRVLSMLGGDTASVRLATLIQMTLPGAPSIYYGDEVGLTGEMDPGCRGAMPWDEAAWDGALFRATAGAIALRHANPTLRHGTFRVVGAGGSGCAYARSDDAATFLIAANAGDAELGLDVSLPELAGRALTFVSWDGTGDAGPGGVRVPDDARVTLRLPARSAAVYRTEG